MASLPKNVSPFTATKDGVRVAVRLTPRANGSRVDGPETGADGSVWLKARVSTAPEKGRANAALLKLLAKEWSVPARDLTLVAGAGARLKQVLLSCDPEDGMVRLTHWYEERFS